MLWAVILAGGSGTRFWPASREDHPKQFLNLSGKRTLLEETGVRLKDLIPRARILGITQQKNRSKVSRQLGIPPAQTIGEPAGRNTAPCAVLAAALAIRKDPRAVLAILPSDHRIGGEKKFRRALAAAAEISARGGQPVTFGIRLKSAHTGYGYLELGAKAGVESGFSFHRLKSFREKPDLKRAEKYFKSSRFLWNSGMFVWRADALLEAASRFLPDAYQLAQKILQGNFLRGMNRYYPAMPNISIDYGLMEKLGRGKILTMPLDLDWSDLGGWQAVAEFWPQDKHRNFFQGESLLIDSSGNIVKAGKRLLAMVGVKDLVVVDSEDALLVCSKDKSESVRKVVARLKEKNWKQYL